MFLHRTIPAKLEMCRSLSILSPQRWQKVSSHLDHALSLSEPERGVWMNSFRVSNPELAGIVEELLAEHDASEIEQFLERPLLEIAESSLAGQTIGPYTLISPLGHGGMGVVWLAARSDGRFERRVAIKFLKFAVASRIGEKRFRQEGQILGQLRHPHIAELIDAGVTSTGEPFLVLEYVEGEPIDEYCDRHKLNVEARIKLFLDVLGSVAHAHSNLIVHRDIKPPNVLVRNDGQVKLLDFGIAKLLGPDGNSAAIQATRESQGALTPQFAAPEQITGGTITTAADVYALGVVLYMILTGQHPAGPGPHSPATLVKAIVETEPTRSSDAVTTDAGTAAAEKRGATPDKLHRQLRGDLDTVLAKALKKNPQERYVSVTAFADDLGRYLKHQPISARPDSIRYRAAKFIRRNRMGLSAVTLALSAILAASGVAVYQARTAERRFQDVRKLAHTFVFDLHDEVAKLEGSIKVREMMVRTGMEYLDNLARNAGGDLELQREIAAAYMKIGDAEGYPTKANLGRTSDALASYAKAGDIYREIAARDVAYVPDLARFYQSYAGLVRFTHDYNRARVISQSGIDTLDRFRSYRPLEGQLAIDYLQAWCTLGDIDEDLLQFHQSLEEYSHCRDLASSQLSKRRDAQGLLLLAHADERVATSADSLGHLDQSLRALEDDQLALTELLAAEPHNPTLHRRLALVHHYRSEVYYSDVDPNLGEPSRALESAKLYLQTAEEMFRSDPANTSAQFSRAIASYKVSFYLRESDPRAAEKLAANSVQMFDTMLASGKSDYLITSRRVRALLHLGEAQLKAGHVAEARATARTALDTQRPVAAKRGAEWDDERRVLIQILTLSAHVSGASGDYRTAESRMEEARQEALQIAQSQEISATIPLANVERAWGALYLRQRRKQDARGCYERLAKLWQQFPETNQYVDLQRRAAKQMLASLD